jgi:hypothetical protein
VSVLTFACFAFDRWLWHLTVFKHWLVNRPYVAGTWKAQLVSNWKDPVTGQQIPPITCIMVIRQTFSTLSVRLFTPESSSASVAYNIERQEDGLFRLFVLYQNIPRVNLRGERSEIHYGAFMLEVQGDPPVGLVGHYWTDRETKGSLELTDPTPKLFNGYNDAKLHFSLP